MFRVLFGNIIEEELESHPRVEPEIWQNIPEHQKDEATKLQSVQPRTVDLLFRSSKGKLHLYVQKNFRL